MSFSLSRRRFLSRQGQVLLGLSALPFAPLQSSGKKPLKGKNHMATEWHIAPSFVFDTLCCLNMLTGDPYYVDYYQKEYHSLAPKLTPEARHALANVKRRIKDQEGGLIGPFLSLLFSSTAPRNLTDLLQTVQESSELEAAFKKTPYYDDDSWHSYLAVRPDLTVIFRFLQAIQFETYWQQEILPVLQQKIDSLQTQVPAYDVVAEDERVLGFALPSRAVTIYLLYFNKPHGIKITGQRFLTGVDYSAETILRNAVHELMHPPFGFEASPKRLQEMWAVVSALKQDKFLMDKIEHHNPAFGYNSFEGFVEEDCVQALEQIASERLALAKEPRERWKESDDGMHVLAVALYALMKSGNYSVPQERFGEFLTRLVSSGALAPGRIKTLYDNFYTI